MCCGSQALVRQNVIETLSSVVASVKFGTSHIATLSTLFLDLLLILLAFRVSFEIAKSFSYPSLAFRRLAAGFIGYWGRQAGPSDARGQDTRA